MIREKSKIARKYNDEDCLINNIELSKLAVPNTVKIFFEGKEIIPLSFNCLGHPNLTIEQVKMIQYELIGIGPFTKENSIWNKQLTVEYEEDIFKIPRWTIDSTMGIQTSLLLITELNKLLENRKRLKFSSKKTLNEFMIFGYIYLNCDGDTFICSPKVKRYKKAKEIELIESFSMVEEEFYISRMNKTIPKNNSYCPCCGRLITALDVKDGNCYYKDEKYYHKNCYQKYSCISNLIDYYQK